MSSSFILLVIKTRRSLDIVCLIDPLLLSTLAYSGPQNEIQLFQSVV